MRSTVPLLTLVLSLASVQVGASHAAEPPPVPPPEQHTIVRGTAPQALTGRWIAVGWIELPGDKARTTVTLWEITEKDDQPVLTVRFAALSPELESARQDADRAEKQWHPQPHDIAQLAATWDGLPPIDPRLVSVQSEIVARDGFDQAFKTEPKTRDAVWAVRQVEKYHASAAPAIQTINVYAVLGPREGGYFGNFTTATVAAAPLPIPITLNGTFQLYRVGDVPSRGFFDRLMDMFRGCGRR
jgi:hypothetical protein